MEHKWKLFTDCCLVEGKVNHSYTLSSLALQPWTIIRSSGAVACGHCTCMAGLGDMLTCWYIAILHMLSIKFVDMLKLVLHQSPMHG